MPFISEIGSATLEQLMASVGLIARFDEPVKVEDELRIADFEPEAVEPHAIESTFENEDAWWDWNWSHGARVFLEALPAGSQERFRGNAYDAMQSLRTDNGFPRRFTAIFSRARSATQEIDNS
jgi:biotin carboxylase